MIVSLNLSGVSPFTASAIQLETQGSRQPRRKIGYNEKNVE
jgi:hypothetical protein